MLHRTALRLALGVALAIAAVQPAGATTLAPLTTDQLVDASTWIVEGRVLDVWTEVSDDGALWTRSRVAVDLVRKGSDLPATVVVDQLGGTLGHARMPIDGTARFSAGESVVLFLSEIDFGRRITTVGMFMGKYSVRRAPGEARSHVLRYPVDPSETWDARFAPHPAPEDRVYLDDLVDQVERRLDLGWQGEAIPGISPEKLTEINTPARRLRR